MTDSAADTGKGKENPEPSTGQPARRMAGSMHDNIEPEWGDSICSCEAEPYWQQAAEELEREQKEQKKHEHTE